MHEENLAQNEVSLRDYFDLLRRRKAIIIQTLVAVVIVGVIVALVSKPVYRSEGRLLITQMAPTLMTADATNPINQLLAPSAPHNIDTQIAILTTPDLMRRAFELAGISPDDPRVRVEPSSNKETDIIDLATEAHRPVIAADVTNNLMNLYITDDVENRKKDLKDAIRYSEGTANDAARKWEETSKKLQRFREKNRVFDITTQVQSQTVQIVQLDDKEKDLQATVDGWQAQIAKTRANLANLKPRTEQEIESTNPSLNAYRLQLSDLQTKYDAQKTLFKPEYPAMRALAAQIEGLKKVIAEMEPTLKTRESVDNPEIRETEATLRQQEAQKFAYLAQLNRVQDQKQVALGKMMQLGKDQYEEAKLIQERDLAQQTSQASMARLADLQLREKSQTSTISILTKATMNTTPVRPKRALIVILSCLAGLFLGICFALLQDFLDDRVNAPEDARRLLGVPALGYIPNISKEEQRLLTAENTAGSVLESYRVLRSNVRFAAVGEPLNTMMVTSTAPGEGKSLTAANLAIAMALDGKRVALVDCDLRRPTVHEKFNVRNTPGLTNVLVGAMPIDRALQDSSVENLQLLTCGPLPPNPAELLNSRAMEQVQEMLKERFDVVIFDTPPCLSVADAQVMAASVDGLIYVVQLGSTRKSALKQGNELLRQAHAKVLGIVYNKVQVDNRRNDYYGYYSPYHKAEIASKGGNGNGKTRGRSEWEELTSQAPDSAKAALTASEPSPTRKSKRSEQVASAETTPAEKE